MSNDILSIKTHPKYKHESNSICGYNPGLQVPFLNDIYTMLLICAKLLCHVPSTSPEVNMLFTEIISFRKKNKTENEIMC